MGGKKKKNGKLFEEITFYQKTPNITSQIIVLEMAASGSM